MAVVTGWDPAGARALDQIAGDDGVVVGVAVDHRDSMSVALRRRGLPEPTAAELSALKLRVAQALAPAASVILLDAEYSAAQALAAGIIPRDTALVIALEAQGYGGGGDVRRTSFLEGWTAQRAAALGAAGCKLLLPYRPDLPDQRVHQEDVVRRAGSQCRAAGVALILEPVVYHREHEHLARARFSALVVDTAARLASLGPQILKLPYPGSATACDELDQACGSQVPWVLLGGGADAATLERQIGEAGAAGASGFIVGRTLFEAALVADPAESAAALHARSRPLLKRLSDMARAGSQPWRARVGEVAAPPLGWYRTAEATASPV